MKRTNNSLPVVVPVLPLVAAYGMLVLTLLGCGRVGFVQLPLDGGGPLVADPPKDSEPPGDEPDTGTACAAPCENDHGSAECIDGTCSLSCDRNYQDCNGDPEDGCEANLASGASGHCGECGTRCGADEACVSGGCEAAPCEPGFAECDADVSEYCETELAMSVEHCGACDDACANDHGSTNCVDAMCQPVCEADYADCDGSVRNGCETSLSTVSDCGLCDRACPANGGTPVCVAGACNTVCDLTGTWALKLDTTLDWGETMYLESSENQPYVMSLRVQITDIGGTLDLQLTECQRVVPEFEAKFPNERSLLSYPTSLYDDHVLPSISIQTLLGSTSPGARFAVPAVAAQLGISLNDPVNDPWPADGGGVQGANRIDMDGDGKDGITANYTDVAPFYFPRTTALVTPDPPRSDTVYLGARAVFALDGTLTSCSESSGSAGFTRVDTRMYGCTIAGSARECDGSETNRIDESVMTYVPEPGSYTLVRVAEGADCAAIRAALP